MLYSFTAIALLLATQAVTHPLTPHRPRGYLQRRMVDLNQYRPETGSTYQNSESTSSLIGSLIKRADYVDAATELVKKVAPDATFRLVEDHYVGNNGIGHVNFKQTAHGVDIDNADFNVNVSIANSGIGKAALLTSRAYR